MSGTVTELRVGLGSFVRAGEVLVRLSAGELEARRAQTRAVAALATRERDRATALEERAVITVAGATARNFGSSSTRQRSPRAGWASSGCSSPSARRTGRDGAEEPSQYVLFGTGAAISRLATEELAVTLAVAKRPGSNAIAVARAVLAQVDRLKGAAIPGDVSVSITRHYGAPAAAKSNELLLHMAIAVVGVLLLVLFMLGWRESLVVAVAIPSTLSSESDGSGDSADSARLAPCLAMIVGLVSPATR